MAGVEDFIANQKLRITTTMVDHNPFMADTDNMDNWRVTLSGNKRRMTFLYSMGIAFHGEPPTIKQVLQSLADDAALIENSRGFDEFCSETGAEICDDTDRRREERSYKQCIRQTERLKTFLGTAAYEQLLWETDR